MEQASFTIEKTFNAPIGLVWKAITDKNEMKKWYFDIDKFEAMVGFEFQFAAGEEPYKKYMHLCKIMEVIPNKKLSYTWRYEGYEGYEGDSLVSIELFEEGKKTRLKLSHYGLETFPASNPDFVKTNFEAGWGHIIGKALLEYLENQEGNK